MATRRPSRRGAAAGHRKAGADAASTPESAGGFLPTTRAELRARGWEQADVYYDVAGRRDRQYVSGTNGGDGDHARFSRRYRFAAPGEYEIRVDTRVVSATHRDLEELVAEGAFREDLYYRLSELSLEIPPLRERPEDAVLLAQRFFDRQPAGKLLTRLTSDVESLGESLQAGVVTIVLDICLIIGILGAMLAFDWQMTVALLVLAPPLLIAIEACRRRLRELYLTIRETLDMSGRETYSAPVDFDVDASKLNLHAGADGLGGSFRLEANGPGVVYAVQMPAYSRLDVGLANRAGFGDTLSHLVAVLEQCPTSNECVSSESASGPCLDAVATGSWSNTDSDQHASWENDSRDRRTIHVMVDSNLGSGIANGELRIQRTSTR